MAKYLKLFDNHDDYLDFTETTDFILPNVSHCIEENEVHYNPIEEKLIITYDMTNSNQIYCYASEGGLEAEIRAVDVFDKVEIDGVEVSTSYLDSIEAKYPFSEGTHTVAYTLKDPTKIDDGMFSWCDGLTSVVFPKTIRTIGRESFSTCYGLNSITFRNGLISIGALAFFDCFSLTSIIFPESITNIGESCFETCEHIGSVTVKASVPPILGAAAFENSSSIITIYVPSESVNTYKAASGWSSYSDRIQAIATT